MFSQRLRRIEIPFWARNRALLYLANDDRLSTTVRYQLIQVVHGYIGDCDEDAARAAMEWMRVREGEDADVLALIGQIYFTPLLVANPYRQCGHRCGGGRARSSRMAWRTAGKVGCGGGPSILFFRLAALSRDTGGKRRRSLS
jgi:hypothetical protein